MSVTKKLKWKRALSTLRFCYEEMDYVKEVSKTSGPEFEAFYRRFCAENDINIGQLDKQNKEKLETLYGNHEITDNSAAQDSDIDSNNNTSIIIHDKKFSKDGLEREKYQMTADEIATHEAFSKLFKRIALKLHPDRVDKTLPTDEIKSRISMFQKVNQALEDRKYYLLLEVAERYSITTPRNYDQQSRWMKREADRLRGVIIKEKNNYNYGFSECDTDEEKKRLIKKFIFQLFGISVQQIVDKPNQK